MNFVSPSIKITLSSIIAVGAIGALTLSLTSCNQVPTSVASNVSQVHVPVTISKTCNNVKFAQAIQTYLVRVSDPTIFKHFIILDVTYWGKTHDGVDVWQVKLDVQHQPNKRSAFGEGINDRFVIPVIKDNQYFVTGLATGV